MSQVASGVDSLGESGERTTVRPSLPREKRAAFLHLYRSMLAASITDEIEIELVHGGEAFFHLGTQGHEGAAVLHLSLTEADWLFPHYRDKSLMLARGLTPAMFFHTLLCTAAAPSAGRQMIPFLGDASRRIMSLNIPVGNHALQAVGVASVVKDDPARPIVLCGLGDGTTQQGEVYEAIAEAVRSDLPVLFWIEDNGLSISTTTVGKTFFSLPGKKPYQFFGQPIHRLNGRDVVACHEEVEKIVSAMRVQRRPALVVFEVERLCNHTNADDERTYRPAAEIQAARQGGNPIHLLAGHLLRSGISRQELDQVAAEVRDQVREAADSARRMGDPKPVWHAKKPLPPEGMDPAREYRGTPEAPRLTMLEAMNQVLRRRLAEDPRVTLYGEDIEDPKGDVFGLTRGLTRAFPGRVINSALSEATILGVSIGRALAGARPVAMIQFADFLPQALNQIMSELGSMYWRTNGDWECPVLVLVACGGYRPGLGPFHAQTMEAIAAHVPGLDVFMPSTAADAAGLLNAAFDSGRPTIFFYPKVSLNDRERTTSADLERHWVPIGQARRVRQGDDLTLVSWGSTMPLCEQAAAALDTAGVQVDLIDLRSLSPWDRETVCASVRRTGKLLVVHEDNQTCGFGAEVLATVAESVPGPVKARRVSRPDTYVPCNFANQLEVLPSFKRILTVAAEMLDLDLTWELPARENRDVFLLEAQGSSPADQSVTVVSWKIRAGDTVQAGQSIADMEADKAVYDLAAPVDGVVAAVLVPEGQPVRVGTPLLRLQTAGRGGIRKRQAREESGTPILRRRKDRVVQPVVSVDRRARTALQVGLSAVYAVEGADRLTNEELVGWFPDKTPKDILKRTGIESRPRLAEGESALTLAVAAARRALEQEGLAPGDLSAVICSTTTPMGVTPSMACLVLHELGQGSADVEAAAHDVNAACSGYLYALAAGFDLLQTRPEGRVLILTTEALTRMVDPADFDTAILFGDAATATVLYGAEHLDRAGARLRRPVLSGKGEDGSILRVPLPGLGFLTMDGKKVFREALRCMAAMLEQSCAEAGRTLEDLAVIVPHQANGRIIDALRDRLRLPAHRVFNHIRHHGNTSSSSIPLALAELGNPPPQSTFGLCAFGGGFTYGAALLEATEGTRIQHG